MKTLSIEPSDDRTFCQKRWISHLHKTIGIEHTKTCEDIIDAVSRHLSEAQMAHYRKKYENGDADMFLSPLSWLRADHIDHIKDKAKGLLDSLLRTGNVSLIDLLHELELESRDTEEVARLLELA